MKKMYLLFSFFWSAASPANAQLINEWVINAAGGSSENGGYSTEWSIGELAAVNQMNASDGKFTLTNGFVQPMQALYYSLSGFVSSGNIRIYPNPTSDFVEIDFLQNITGTISIQLSNPSGQVMYKNEIVVDGLGFIEKINLKNYTRGNYTLYLKRIKPGSGEYESAPFVYKIIKL